MATLSVYFFATMVLLSWLPTLFGCCLKSGLRLLPWYGWYFEQHGGIFVSKKWTKDREHIIQTLKAASKLNVPVRRDLPNEAEETSVVINVCVCVCVCVYAYPLSPPSLSLFVRLISVFFYLRSPNKTQLLFCTSSFRPGWLFSQKERGLRPVIQRRI